ncbi:MAG: trehalose-6-phosphate synthase [Candidatus Levybacteria bacterium]|nr:trehalose-6-phosphate synthase [Candidatus Levybacteria bacterium]
MLERARFWRKETNPQTTQILGPSLQPQQPSLEVRIFEEQHINATLTIQTEPQKQAAPVQKAEIFPSREAEKTPFERILIISNRLPADVVTTEKGQELVATVGGLAKALHAVARNSEKNGNEKITNGNTNGKKNTPEIRWLGWDGQSNGQSEMEGLEEAFETLSEDHIIKLHSLSLPKDELDAYYHRISNNGFWMLFHGREDLAKFDLKDWSIYNRVDQKFAIKGLDTARAEDFIWIQDYHQMRTAFYMRELGVTNKIGFFLHIPFPNSDTLQHLPEQIRNDMLEGLLAHDIVGFQTEKDRNNFILSVLQYVPGASINTYKDRLVITKDGRSITVGAYPISIDPQEIKDELDNPAVHAKAEEFKNQFPGKKIISSISRLDPTKGIIETIDAYEEAVNEHPEHREETVLNLVAKPSRLDTPVYNELYEEVKRRVEQARKLGILIQFIPGLTPAYALAMQQVSDIEIVGSTADGMNLVAKEYAVAGPENGVLILGRHAGAAQELGEHALVINPSDTKAFAKAISDALTMSEDEKIRRKAAMNDQVHIHDVELWADRYLNAARAA